MATKHPINASFVTSKCCTTKLSIGLGITTLDHSKIIPPSAVHAFDNVMSSVRGFRCYPINVDFVLTDHFRFAWFIIAEVRSAGDYCCNRRANIGS